MKVNINSIQKKYLNWVSTASPVSSFTISFAVLAICLYFEFKYSHSIFLIVSFLFSGWIVWGFTEYMIHRFIFHIKSTNKYILLFRYIMHGVHHHEPAKTLFVPVILRIIIQILVFIILKLILNEYAFLFFAGLVIGVLQYILVHYCIHHKRLSNYFPKLTRYHYIHHFVEPDTVFGTSTLFWDRIFGTLPSKEYFEMEYKEIKHFIV